LGAFLKVAGAAGTGGAAKLTIQSGRVKVNGSVETRRGHKVSAGDRIAVDGEEYRACLSPT
jgi:ribosome-associated protein